jgi:hypothetical protein
MASHAGKQRERRGRACVYPHSLHSTDLPSITYSNQHASKLRLLTRKTTRRSRHWGGGWDSWNVNNRSPRRPAAWFLPDFVPPHPALHLPSWDWPLSHLSGRIIANYRAPQEQSSRSRSHAFPGRQSQTSQSIIRGRIGIQHSQRYWIFLARLIQFYSPGERSKIDPFNPLKLVVFVLSRPRPQPTPCFTFGGTWWGPAESFPTHHVAA